jgi:hypothetical protein
MEKLSDLHNSSILVYLPYDIDKIRDDIHINLKIGKDTGIKGIDNAADKQNYYSFSGNDNTTKYFKKIAQNDSPTSKGEGDNAVAFVEIDKNGEIIKNKGKENLHIIFPGMNNFMGDISNVSKDLVGVSSYNPEFMRDFNNKLKTALDKNHININHANIKVFGHSSGDKNALQFAMDFKNSKLILAEPIDNRDALAGALVRKTINESNFTNTAEFKKNLESNLNSIVNRTEVYFGKSSFVGLIADDFPITNIIYNSEKSGHVAKDFAFLKPTDIKPEKQNYSADKLIEHSLKYTEEIFSNSINKSAFFTKAHNLEQIDGLQLEQLKEIAKKTKNLYPTKAFER